MKKDDKAGDPALSAEAVRERFARRLVAGNFLGLQERFVDPTFDIEHWRRIHLRLFGDTDPQAGEFRAVNIVRGRGHVAFNTVAAGDLESRGEKIFERLAQADRFRGLLKEPFVEALAGHMNELNTWYPFRHGNARTMALYVSQLVKHAGYTLTVDRLYPDPWHRSVFIAATTDDLAPLRTLLRAVVTPTRAIAFAKARETFDRNSALEQHTELRHAFETFDRARELLPEYGGKGVISPEQERNHRIIAAELQRQLDAGQIPLEPTAEILRQYLKEGKSFEQ